MLGTRARLRDTALGYATPRVAANTQASMLDRYTAKAEKALAEAARYARDKRANFLGTEHVLLGLLAVADSMAYQIIEALDVDVDELRQVTEETLRDGSADPDRKEVPYTPHAKRCLELSSEEAVAAGRTYVATEHLLIGLAREEEGIAAYILKERKLDKNRIVREPRKLTKKTRRFVARPRTDAPETPNLDTYGVDLTELARRGQLDPVIGRDRELNRVMETLCRRTKNNPVVLGEPGVGKTAIVEGLAQRIVAGKVPERLQNKRIVSFDLTSVIAGTKYRGEFEERIKKVLAEIIEAQHVILFIDEIHMIVGAGGSEGALDASNIFKPPLSRGQLHCIGATTLSEYRKYIEKDGALERRFHTIMVEPPSEEETLHILKGLKDRYEAHHRVYYTDKALERAVELSQRYISERFLPDKAIDVIDAAGARLRMRAMNRPEPVSVIEDEIDELFKEIDGDLSNADGTAVANLSARIGRLQQHKKRLMNEWKRAEEESGSTVDEPEIVESVAQITGIPMANLSQSEAEKLLHMEDDLAQNVIGQKEPIAALCQAIRRSRSGLREPTKPIGSFLFVGPTGVGKTHLAKALATFLFADKQALIRVDMSEYMEKHATSRLIGAAPGYVGYEEGGQLTEAVRRKPYAVVLFDEIEKAHPDVYNILLQVLDEGRLTDNVGRVVDFKNTVIILTSNLGVQQIESRESVGFSASTKEEGLNRDVMREEIKRSVEQFFRPEFLNRFDDTLVFDYLEKEDLRKIVDIEVASIVKRLAQVDAQIELSPATYDYLITRGFHRAHGARPLKRTIERTIETPLSDLLIGGKVPAKATVEVNHIEGDAALTLNVRTGSSKGTRNTKRAKKSGGKSTRKKKVSPEPAP
jgi:ATP-dependent Clp protease ATP-binding subunit ClpC